MATHEINIYGDIVPFHSGWGDEFSLSDLNSALLGIQPAEGDELIFNIHTFGGCTATAFGIYNKLKRFAAEKKISLTSRVDGWCASSGVIILLAGDRRIGNQYAEPFIHNAWSLTMGDKNELQKVVEDLVRVDDMISGLYAERTNISKEEAVALMNADGHITAEQSLEYGFFTEMENVEVVELEIMNSIRSRNSLSRKKFKTENMTKEKQSIWNRLKKEADALFGTAPKNKILLTATSKELDFYELDEDATPKIGDKAKFDGKPAGESNGGEYVMQSGETYKFTGEELTEIVPKAEEPDTLETENAELKVEVENLKKEIQNLKTEKTAILNKLTSAEKLVKEFQNFSKDADPDDEAGRREAAKNDPPKNKRDEVRGAFKNLKK